MSNWPNCYGGAWTLAESTLRRGVGLHSGLVSEIRLSPSEKAGFHVSWFNDIEPPITLSPTQVSDTQLCTTLRFSNNRRLSTVEHLLAALAGCGITHAEIQSSGEEVPLLDGSALGWVEAIQEAGVVPLKSSPPSPIVLKEPILLTQGGSVITATPAEQLKLVVVIEFPQRAIGKQFFSIVLTPEKFVKEIAPARTFGFLDQVEHLRGAGLIKGAGLENALVCDGDSWLNPPLRFPNEPVRHKLLDLLGDLALVGFPRAQILVYKGSHRLHTDLAAALFSLT